MNDHYTKFTIITSISSPLAKNITKIQNELIVWLLFLAIEIRLLAIGYSAAIT